MPRTMSGSRRPARPPHTLGEKAPLKSPLAVSAGTTRTPVPSGAAEGTALTRTDLSVRGATLAEFEDYLRTVNSRDGRPYEEKTIVSYVGPGKNLDAWMTGNGIDGDFTVLDVRTLNKYFRAYYLSHGQGGTHTLQRNLIQLFKYLEHEHGYASPYRSDDLNRYTPVEGRPKTLGEEFIEDLLEALPQPKKAQRRATPRRTRRSELPRDPFRLMSRNSRQSARPQPAIPLPLRCCPGFQARARFRQTATPRH
jgi:hypothetical protein